MVSMVFEMVLMLSTNDAFSQEKKCWFFLQQKETDARIKIMTIKKSNSYGLNILFTWQRPVISFSLYHNTEQER